MVKSFGAWLALAVALCFAAPAMAQSTPAGGSLFPPQNPDKCTADSALRWTGSSLTCDKVIKTIPNLGSPLLAKIVAENDYAVYNWIINHWINTTMANAQESTREHWRNGCLTTDGILPDYNKNPIQFEYCMRALCWYRNGKWPFMARLSDACNAGGSPDCNYGNFHISAQCLTTAD